MREFLATPRLFIHWPITSVFRSANHKPWEKHFDMPPTNLISEAIRDVEQTRNHADVTTDSQLASFSEKLLWNNIYGLNNNDNNIRLLTLSTRGPDVYMCSQLVKFS